MTDRPTPESEPISTDRKVTPIVEERAVVLKRKTLTEGVRVRTVVREEEATVEEPVATEEVDLERVPLGTWVEAPVPVRQEGDRCPSPRARTSSGAPRRSRSAARRPSSSA